MPIYNVSLIHSDLHLDKCLKILKLFCGSGGRKIYYRPVISSRSYLAIFIRNEISSNDLGKYIRVFQTREIYKINKHILERI